MEPTFNRILQVIALFLLCTAPFSLLAQNPAVEVITLKYRTAEQVMPLLRPLLDKTGTMTGLQNQLVVRTSPANLNDLKKVLATIDAMPRQLLITVRQDAAVDRERSEVQAGGRIVTGVGSVVVGDAPRGGESGLRGRLDNTRALSEDRSAQSIQVLEGNSAYIQFGQSVPVAQPQVTRTMINGKPVDRVSNNVDYRDAQTGFHVLPRLAGDRVTLEISPQRDTFAAPVQNLPAGSVNTQRAATTVSGRLGEWMEIGGVAQSATNQQTVILGSTRETSSDNRRILVKVDEIR